MSHIILSLDGNIGAGKSTLLAQIRAEIPEIHVVDEPVGQWTALQDANGKNLLELFYEDKKRWAYTFQNCAILTRLQNIQEAVNHVNTTTSGPQVILTERSVLTDKYVFAQMLLDTGFLDTMEWELYNRWFTLFHTQHPVTGIIYLSTGSTTSKERIQIRNRQGEDKISLDYLDALDAQHKQWVENTELPVLTLSTEPGSSQQQNLQQIREFMKKLRESSASK
uniref:Deoxynucleoside kinase domain-containing protein n=1 Tax=viral metagenome TaxID=1070528 RepID=A0A6C0HKN0_9ZZZZ